MDEELKKEEKAKVQQRRLKVAKGGKNPRKILPTRKRGKLEKHRRKQVERRNAKKINSPRQL